MSPHNIALVLSTLFATAFAAGCKTPSSNIFGKESSDSKGVGVPAALDCKLSEGDGPFEIFSFQRQPTPGFSNTVWTRASGASENLVIGKVRDLSKNQAGLVYHFETEIDWGGGTLELIQAEGGIIAKITFGSDATENSGTYTCSEGLASAERPVKGKDESAPKTDSDAQEEVGAEPKVDTETKDGGASVASLVHCKLAEGDGPFEIFTFQSQPTPALSNTVWTDASGAGENYTLVRFRDVGTDQPGRVFRFQTEIDWGGGTLELDDTNGVLSAHIEFGSDATENSGTYTCSKE